MQALVIIVIIIIITDNTFRHNDDVWLVKSLKLCC